MRLFKASGINVYLHWSWFALVFVFYWIGAFEPDPFWGVMKFLALFAIVLLHEFGHALACRSVGGRANTIMLWPLGGVAFVSPPPRPGAVLWSIAAGPLVNVLLVPVTLAAYVLVVGQTPMGQWSPIQDFVASVTVINALLLAFNMLPIYPLDGGQILQSILWFFVGRTRSLRFAAIVGLVCAPILFVIALLIGWPLLLVIAIFIGWQAYMGYRAAVAMAQREQMMNPWEATR